MELFEVKVKYPKILDEGKTKNVTEAYIFDAVTFSEAESKAASILGDEIDFPFEITAIATTTVSDIIRNENDNGLWFKSAVMFTTLDEGSGKEKDTKLILYVQAFDSPTAVGLIVSYYEDSISDFKIKSVTETNVFGIHLNE